MHASPRNNSCQKPKNKTCPGKSTSDYSELPRNGARIWRSKQEPFVLPTKWRRWTVGWRLVPWPCGGVRSLFLQVSANSKLLPLPGGRRRTRDYDSSVFRVVQPPGTLSELVEPLPWAQPWSASSPCRRNGCRAQAVPIALLISCRLEAASRLEAVTKSPLWGTKLLILCTRTTGIQIAGMQLCPTTLCCLESVSFGWLA